ncbi:hypothetical protein DFH09DRAFT_1291663 [Mycena vulgaris]|nr:hypothetical protein DFH09DRAFT_1291663 [Mycena vulgaris]
MIKLIVLFSTISFFKWTTAIPPYFSLPVGVAIYLVAIYLVAPLWAYQVADYASIDFLPSVLVDLEDYGLPNEGGGPEVISAQAVCGLTNLQNTISFVPGWQYVAVDAFIYHCSRRGGSDSRHSHCFCCCCSHDHARPLSLKDGSDHHQSYSGRSTFIHRLRRCALFKEAQQAPWAEERQGNTGTRSTKSTGRTGSFTVSTKPWPATGPSEPSLT